MCPPTPSLRSAGVSGPILADDFLHRQCCEAALEVYRVHNCTVWESSCESVGKVGWSMNYRVSALTPGPPHVKCPWTRPWTLNSHHLKCSCLFLRISQWGLNNSYMRRSYSCILTVNLRLQHKNLEEELAWLSKGNRICLLTPLSSSVVYVTRI